MDHLRRLYRVWNWLPAFRAVAETEHLPTASERLHVTPSALSRSIKQLEQELGRPLFRRVGRRLELSPSGEELLRALRESMSRLEKGLSAASTSQFVGPIRISAREPFATGFVIDALDALVDTHPLVVPHLDALEPSVAQEWVSDRRLDVAVIAEPIPDDALTIHRLGPMPYAIYCGAQHALFDRPTPSLDEVLRHPFVAPPDGVRTAWPREVEREVGLVASDLSAALTMCARGKLLALLPDMVARGFRATEGPLRRVPVELGASHEVFVVFRKTSLEGPVQALLDELQIAFGRVATR